VSTYVQTLSFWLPNLFGFWTVSLSALGPTSLVASRVQEPMRVVPRKIPRSPLSDPTSARSPASAVVRRCIDRCREKAHLAQSIVPGFSTSGNAKIEFRGSASGFQHCRSCDPKRRKALAIRHASRVIVPHQQGLKHPMVPFEGLTGFNLVACAKGLGSK